ncbi:MAG: acetyltransferase [Planctomyces sp.]|nr:acetyltransferase [Planctomyces sp.]
MDRNIQQSPQKPLILWGARGHAKVLNEFLPRLGFRIVAVFDNAPVDSPPIAGVPVFVGMPGFRHWRSENPASDTQALIAIGGHRGRDRLEIQQELCDAGILPATAVHPTAFVAADACIGDGSQILGNAAVCTEAVIGKCCIINTSASVDHECSLGDGVHIAPGATLTGCVSIGEHSMIGAGAVVLPRIRIGRSVIIGAGSVVTRDIPDGKVAFGNPARIIRDNN